jgi:formylglycine-generating enzyme required for sulfatase activity
MSYQLTHDYLVHSLREWLSRKQRETRRGRAELRLAALAPLWHAKPGPRRLPSLTEWLDILCYTRPRSWFDAERKMMRAATRHYALRGLALAGGLAIVVAASLVYRGRMRGEGLVSKLLVADTAQIAAIVKEIDDDGSWTRHALERVARDSARSPKERLHASLALFPADAARGQYLLDRLLESEPDELIVISERLGTRKAAVLDRLWEVASDASVQRRQRFRAAGALAALDPENQRWRELSRDVAASLVLDENAFRLERWLDALRPVRNALPGPMAAIFKDRTRSAEERFKATVILEQLAKGDTPFLVKLIRDADLRQYSLLLPLLKPHGAEAVSLLEKELDEKPPLEASEEAKNELASQQANAAVTLLALGHEGAVWPLLRHSPEPRVRGYLLDRIESRDVNPALLLARLREEKDASARPALILALAHYDAKRLSSADTQGLVRELLETFRADPHPGIHSAVELLLRRYGHGDQIDAGARSLEGAQPAAGRAWYINRQGHTMVVIDPRGEDRVFSCGRPLDRVFAMASKEVSVEQFRRFRSELDYSRHDGPAQNCPVNCVTWYDAAAYCRWMSEQEGMKEEEMCYPPIEEIKEGMRMPANYLRRTGYRLPTEAEAEYACRAGALTSRFFGSADGLLGRYAYYRGNSQDHSWPVGSLWPNDLGLFDILGNVLEWCQESRSTVLEPEDREDTDAVSNKVERVVHSGSYEKPIGRIRSNQSEHAIPAVQFDSIGFRVARTVRPGP